MTADGGNSFDPYYIWLGIPPAEQPPTFYRLLGLRDFESNVRAIENAADRLMLQIRSFQAGPNGVAAQKILNEISQARLTLCDDARRAGYDQHLRARMMPATPHLAAPHPMPAATPLPQQAPQYHAQMHGGQQAYPPQYAQPLPPHQSPAPYAPAPLPVPQAVTATPRQGSSPILVVDTNAGQSSSAPTRSAVRRKASQGGGLPMTIIKAVIGGAGGLALGIIVVWVGFRADPFGLFGDKAKVEAKAPAEQGTRVIVKPSKVNNPPLATQPSPTNTVGATPVESNPHPDGVGADAGNSEPSSAPPSGIDPQPPTNASSMPAGSAPSSSSPFGTVPNDSSSPSVILPSASPPVPGPMPGENDPRPLNNPVPFGPMPPQAETPKERAPSPTPDVQKAKLAELKEIYKSEFDSATKPANREAFVEFLMTTASKVKSDPDAQFVLYREAYDRALALKDFSQAAKVIDAIEGSFEVDPFRLRTHLLTQASPAARQPADRFVVARCALELAEAAISRKRVAEAQKLANIAEVHVKLVPDPQFRSQAQSQLTEIDKAVAQAAPIERAEKTLQNDPDSPEANLVLGKYRCLTEGDWETGLPMLAKCSDGPLSSVARLDLTAAEQGTPPAAIGDEWFEIAKKGEYLKQCYLRAEHWYRQATAGTDGLDRIRIEQRLEQIAALSLSPVRASTASQVATLRRFAQMFSSAESFDPVNVFAHLNPALLRNSTGPWWGSGDSLYSNSRASRAWLQSRYAPPREYQVSLRVNRSDVPDPGDPGFIIGLSTPRQQFVVAIDAVGAGGYATAISLPNLKPGATNPTLVTYPNRKLGGVYRLDQATRTYSYLSSVVCQVAQKEIRVYVNGEKVTSFDGDFNQLAVPREWAVPDPKCLFIGSHMSRFEVERWVVEPISDIEGQRP